MSEQWPGGFVTKTPPTPQGNTATSSAYGIWNLSQQAGYQQQGLWPDANNPVDPQFNYVTMLLHGDGTNGAQNNTFLDSSSNAFTITRNGNTTQGSFSPYGSGWSNRLNSATSDYQNIGSAGNWKFLNDGSVDWTIECWVNLADTSSRHEIFSTNTNSITNGYGITCGTNGSAAGDVFIQITNGVDGNAFGVGTSGGALSIGGWAHVAFTFNHTTKTLTIFVNGTQAATSTSGSYSFGNANPSYTLQIGRWIGAASGVGGYYNGYISNLRMVSGSILYTSTFTPSTTPLTAVSGTQLLTCQSNRFIDNSSNAYAVTTYSSTSVQRFNPFGTSTAYSTATIGGSGYFDGSGDYLSTTGSYSLGGNFTIEGWMYATTTGARPFGKGDHINAGGIGIYCSGTTFTVTIAGVQAFGPTYSFINQWLHFALVRTSGSLVLYLNGVSQGSVGDSSAFTGNTYVAASLYSGTVYATSACNMSDVRVVSSAVYSGNFTPPSAPLTAITNTQLLTNMTNGAIYDNAMMNDLETVGNAQISTSVKKYGTGSLAFDGTGDYLAAPYNSNMNLGSGNFTIEYWVYFNSTANNQEPANGNNGSALNWAFNTVSGNLTYYLSASGTSYDIASAVSMGSITSGQWIHVALVRNGSTFTPYLNGVAGTTTTSSSAIYDPQLPTYIGGIPAGYGLNGYIDDFRITKGYARYTTTFTPPTAAFPNIGPN